MQPTSELSKEGKISRKKFPKRDRAPRDLRSMITINTVILGPSAIHIPLHVGNVVELGNVTVFLEVGALMLRHRLHEILNDFVRDKRVPKVEFSHVRL